MLLKKAKNILRYPRGTVWLAVIVLYLVVVDSNFKVTLRQPYPGIFSYFLWGMLVSSIKLTPVNCESR